MSSTTFAEQAAALEHANLELERWRTEAKEFARLARHDLSGPLHNIEGFIWLLARRYGDALGPDARPLLEGALRGVEQLERMIDASLERLLPSSSAL